MRAIKNIGPSPADPTRKSTGWQTGKAQPLVFVLAIIILAVGCGIFWVLRTRGNADGTDDVPRKEIRLSDPTRMVLKRLNSPVEIRFYSLLGKEGGSDSLQAFSGRVEQLLAEYERVAGGNINVISYNTPSEADLDAASSDGIKAFNLAKGDPCFLGLSVAKKDQKVSLPRITPAWEQALEADLTRAILRVSGARSIAEQAAATRSDTDAGEELKRSIPNLDSVSLEDGRQILRDRSLKEITAAAAEMQNQIQEARKRLSEAQIAGSEAEQKTAMSQLSRIQAAQAERLREISARLNVQITALERLKGGAPSSR